MLKRELNHSTATLEGPHTKKRKDDEPSSDDVQMEDGRENTIDGHAARGESKENAKSQGLELWQAVKDAVNKEGRILSLEFIHKPPKRHYADYYQQIQNPVFLGEIKKKLDEEEYPTFEAVRNDLETCFQNAKRYNIKESQIWKDAKHLHKLVLKEYARMVPQTDEHEHVDVVEDGDGDGDGKKKTKVPNMNRQLKSRLMKLIEKTDDTGRILSSEFMELPSKKDWPIYYKEIKRPQCFENIFKHLKRKEYLTSAEFANDVELVFSNALHFNQDGTQIFEDARLLRDYFKQLMSDLPKPLALSQYSKSAGKIKLKMPRTSGSGPSPAGAPLPSSNHAKLRIQDPTPAKVKSPAIQPTVVSAPPPAGTSPALRPAPLSTQTQFVPASSTTPQPQTQPLSYLNMAYSHYPNASYQPPVTGSASHPAANSVPPAFPQASQSPAPPPVRVLHPIKCVFLKTEPKGRPFMLHHQDGVRSWAVRLGFGENAVRIADVKFLPVEDEEGDVSAREEEEEEGVEKEDDDEDDEVGLRNGRKKKKGKGRRKSSGKAGRRAKSSPKKSKAVLPPEEVQVKLNGSQLDETEDSGGEWYAELPVGSHVLEIGAKDGMVWKVFAERVSE